MSLDDLKQKVISVDESKAAGILSQVESLYNTHLLRNYFQLDHAEVAKIQTGGWVGGEVGGEG